VGAIIKQKSQVWFSCLGEIKKKKKNCDVVIFVNARNAFPCEMMISSRDETQKKNSLFLIENA
jgi:hypothetical protein